MRYIVPQYSNGIEGKETVYTDRLLQWDRKKHDALCKKHFGNEAQYWGGRSPETIQAFLCEYYDKNILLCKIDELENASNGYPYWRFDFIYLTTETDGEKKQS